MVNNWPPFLCVIWIPYRILLLTSILVSGVNRSAAGCGKRPPAPDVSAQHYPFLLCLHFPPSQLIQSLFPGHYPTDHRRRPTVAAPATPPHCRCHTVRLVGWTAGKLFPPRGGGAWRKKNWVSFFIDIKPISKCFRYLYWFFSIFFGFLIFISWHFFQLVRKVLQRLAPIKLKSWKNKK